MKMAARVYLKALERIVFNALYGSISPQISTSQFGFMQNHSSVQQLLTFLRSIQESFSKVDAIYFDIRKAFGLVSHYILLERLYSFGVTGSVWKFVRAYLHSRKQCVAIRCLLSMV